MMRNAAFALLVALCLGTPAVAGNLDVPTDPVVTLPEPTAQITLLGCGRLFSNDALGDGQDRWRTGAYSVSTLFGPAGTRTLTDAVGEIWEVRLGNRILAPANTVTPAAGDRRYAGLLTAGLFTPFKAGPVEVSLGAELVASGPMTGVGAFQRGAHNFFGIDSPSDLVLNNQFSNAIYGAAQAEIGWPIALGDNVVLRPFVEGRYGDETYLRAGADLLIGSYAIDGITARDYTTGQLYQILEDEVKPGLSFLIGADTAKVFSSVWLPASEGYTLTDWRSRLRAGVHYQGERVGVFYGVTWLSPEFTAQPSGQLVGSVQLQFKF